MRTFSKATKFFTNATQNLAIYSAIILAIFTPFLSHSQVVDLFTVNADQKSNLENYVDDAVTLKIDNNALLTMSKSQQTNQQLNLPIGDGEIVTLILEQSQLFADDYSTFLASNPNEAKTLDHGTQFWGRVAGEDNSLVSLTMTKRGIAASFSIEGINYNLAKVEKEDYILFTENKVKSLPDLACGTDDEAHFVGSTVDGQVNKNSSECVNIYMEIEHQLVQEKGSASAAYDHVLAIFNQVALLYKNDGINVKLSEMLIWDVEDPYTGTNTFQHLNSFRNQINGTFNGDIAHLVGTEGNGGIAYIDVLCNKNYAVGYSDIGTGFAEVPVYSWAVEVMTHEMGHNLGSKHTHACAWNGNNTAIDGCGPAAGYSEGCNADVPSKGTIMSYCHLVSGVGIDFNLGFGAQPAALIQSKVANASCLKMCEGDCDQVGQSCEDGDPCTSGETIDEYCECTGGTIVDNDNDGYCDINDPNDNDGCIPDDSAEYCQEEDGCVVKGFDSFEDDLGIWIDGGSDVHRVDFDQYATSGMYTIRLRDNSGEQSSITTNELGMNDAQSLKLSFAGFAVSMETGEDLILELSFDNGTFKSYEKWVSGTDFNNNERFFVEFELPGLPTANTIKVRLRADASSNSDMVYLDDLKIELCGQSIVCEDEGNSCDDGDVCTVNDYIDADCNCVGTYEDKDEDGYCVGEDGDDLNPCFPDINSENCEGEGECLEISNSDFESGWGFWNDGGSDVTRSLNFQEFAFSGYYCIRIRDNSGWNSSVYSDEFSMEGHSTVKVSFNFYPRGMENTEDFFLEISNNGGTTFLTAENWTAGQDFENLRRYFAEVEMSSLELTDNMVIRFRADGSGNSDIIYLDDIKIEACDSGNNYSGVTELEGGEFINNVATNQDEVASIELGGTTIDEELDSESDLDSDDKLSTIAEIYPSPAMIGDMVNVVIDNPSDDMILTVYDLQGKEIQQLQIDNQNNVKLPTQGWKPGYYVVNIATQHGMDSKKLVVVD